MFHKVSQMFLWETLEAAIRSLENLLSKRLNIFKKHVWSGPIF